MSDNELTVKIKIRYDTDANWGALNPVLLRGEVALSGDKGMYKAGDGASTWNSLPYNKASSLYNLTSTVQELNYVKGVTSSIQNQLNAKASASHTHRYAGSSSAGGAANSALRLSSPRTIALKGAVTGSASFDGSSNLNLNVTANPVQTFSSVTSDSISCSSLTINGLSLEDYITNVIYPEETGTITPVSGGIMFPQPPTLTKRNKTVQLNAGLAANTAITGTFPIISTWATIQSGFRPASTVFIETELLYGDMNTMTGSTSCEVHIDTSGHISIVDHGSINSASGTTIYLYAFMLNCTYITA